MAYHQTILRDNMFWFERKQNIRKKDFLVFSERCGMNQKSAVKILSEVVSRKETYIRMCRDSYLPENMKLKMADMICARIEILDVCKKFV